MTEIEAFKTWFSTSGFWNDAITGKAWIAACAWQREQIALTQGADDHQLRLIMDRDEWRNAMAGLCCGPGEN